MAGNVQSLLLQEGCHDPPLAAFLGLLLPPMSQGCSLGLLVRISCFWGVFSVPRCFKGREGSEFPGMSWPKTLWQGRAGGSPCVGTRLSPSVLRSEGVTNTPAGGEALDRNILKIHGGKNTWRKPQYTYLGSLIPALVNRVLLTASA